MAEDTNLGGALYVYGSGGLFRYTVKDNPDLPDCIDLVYEDFDEKKKVWEQKAELPAIDIDLWEKLTRAVHTLNEWMQEADTADEAPEVGG